MSAYLKSFSEIPSYSDPSSQNQFCRDLLPKGIVPGLMVGFDHIEGIGRNGIGNHSDWHQVYVVMKGSGLLIRGDERIPIQAPCIVHIPPHTDHDVLVDAGQSIEYVYINKYLAE